MIEGVKRYLEVADYSTSNDIDSSRYGCKLVVLFPEPRMFRSSAKRDNFTGYLILSFRSLMTIGKRLTEMMEPSGTTFSFLNIEYN